MVVGVFAVYVVCCSLLGEIGKDVLAVATDSNYEILHETHFVADFVVDPRGCVLVYQEGRNSSRRELSFYSSEPPPEAPSGSRNACSNATCGKKTGFVFKSHNHNDYCALIPSYYLLTFLLFNC